MNPSKAAVVANDSDEEDNFDEAAIAEAERWEQSFEKLPVKLRPGYTVVIGDFNINTRIRIYKIIDIFEWNYEDALLILDVLVKAKAGENINAILKLFELAGPRHILNLLNILNNIDYSRIKEFIHIPESQSIKLLDVAYYVQKKDVEGPIYSKDFELLYDFIQKLNVTEVIRILETCNEPMAKKCRLCTQKRVASLEYRMLQNQLEPGSVSFQRNII